MWRYNLIVVGEGPGRGATLQFSQAVARLQGIDASVALERYVEQAVARLCCLVAPAEARRA